MAPEVVFTLHDMAKLALGGYHLTTVNVTVLHSLINVILKKLNCEDEKVTISGMEAKCLLNLLKSSQAPDIHFNDENVDMIGSKLERLAKLQESIKKTESTLDCHFDEIQKCKAIEDLTLKLSNWERFKKEAEHECITCQKNNEFACTLIKNEDFVKKLQRRIANSVVHQLFEMETKVEHLRDDLISFIQLASEHYKKIALVDGCIEKLDELRQRIQQNELKFLGAMEEVQDVLDIKADKMYIPALKQFVQNSLESMAEMVKELQTYRDCPKPEGIIMSGVRCLSCGDRNVAAEVGVHVVGMLPNAIPHKEPPICNMPRRKEKDKDQETKKSYHTYMLNPNIIPMTDPPKVTGADVCLSSKEKLRLLVGTDGNLYRKA